MLLLFLPMFKLFSMFCENKLSKYVNRAFSFVYIKNIQFWGVACTCSCASASEINNSVKGIKHASCFEKNEIANVVHNLFFPL